MELFSGLLVDGALITGLTLLIMGGSNRYASHRRRMIWGGLLLLALGLWLLDYSVIAAIYRQR